MEKTTRYGRTIQLWPAGTSVTIDGDGDRLVVKTENGRWKKPDDELRRKIEIELRAEWLLEHEVQSLDSCLVDDLLKASVSGELPNELAIEWDYDSISNVYADPSDWTLAQCRDWCEEHGVDCDAPNPAKMDRAELVELLTDASIECRDDETTETLCAAVEANIDDETIDGIDEWRDAVRDNASEYAAEIYEWRRVTPYLARVLGEIGECVLENSYGEYWGRCCTGQSVMMDGTLQAAAARILDR